MDTTAVVEKSCNTCVHHVQGRSIDDCPASCWDCLRSPDFSGWQEDVNPSPPLPLIFKHEPFLPVKKDDPAPTNALDVQVGGGHYKKLKIQPIVYIHANNIPFAEGNVIKYATRWRDKGGINDLKKARHILDMLIELESKPNAV